MTITVNMSKEEFLEYCNYKDFKSSIKCSIIDLKDNINGMMKMLLEDEVWKDNNKYDKKFKKICENLDVLERGAKDADSKM